MMVMCNANAIVENDERRPGLPSAPVVMEHDNSSLEQTEIQLAISLNIRRNCNPIYPYLHTHVHSSISTFIIM